MEAKELALDAMMTAAEHLQALTDGQVDCGDPGVECPLHDCRKEYSTAGVLVKLAAAIMALKAEGK